MKQYEAPRAEAILFENDVITASGSPVVPVVPTHTGGSN